MKVAIILAYAVIVVLAIILFMQWRTIQKLIPAPPVRDSGTQRSSGDGSGSFGAQMDAMRNSLQPKEITAKF